MKRNIKIISLIMAITVAMAFTTSCGASPSETSKAMLDGIKAQDTSAIAKVYDGKASTLKISNMAETFTVGSTKLTKGQKKVIKKFTNKLLTFDYKIISEKKSGGTAVVKVKFTTYDFGSMMTRSVNDFQAEAVEKSIYGGSTSNSALTKMLISILNKENAKLTKKNKTVTATLKLKKSGGEWKVTGLSDKALDAMYGGLLTSINDISSQIESNGEK